MQIDVKFEGLDAVLRVLRSGPRKVAVKETLAKYGALICDEAKDIVPVDTGALQASIRKSVTGQGMNVRIAPNTYYAGYVEFGTWKMQARPYMRPAFSRYEPELMRELAIIMLRGE